MRDFKIEIDGCDDLNNLRDLLAQLSAEIQRLEAIPYEDGAHEQRLHDLELLLRYGEHRLDRMLA